MPKLLPLPNPHQAEREDLTYKILQADNADEENWYRADLNALNDRYPPQQCVNPWLLALSLTLGSLRVRWAIRRLRRRGRLALILSLPSIALRAWRLARRAWR